MNERELIAAEAEAMALVMSHEGAIERLTAERDALAKRATAAEYRLEDRWANPEEIGEREAYIRTLKTENEQLRAALELGLGFVAAHDSQMPQSKLALMARMRATLAPRETTREEK